MRYAITRKAANAFVIILILMLMISVISILALLKEHSGILDLIDENQKGYELFLLQSEVKMISNVAKDFVITGDEKFIEIYNRVDDRIEAKINKLSALLSGAVEHSKLSDIKSNMADIRRKVHKLFDLKKHNSIDSLNIIVESMGMRIGKDLDESVIIIINQLRSNAEMIHERIENENKNAIINISIILFLAITVAILVVILTMKRVSKPILKLETLARRISSRDFNVRIQSDSKDEIGLLIKAFNEMASEIGRRYEELENFSHIAAHDLKSPLNSITGSAELLLQDCEDKITEDEKTLLGNIVLVGRKMNNLITDLLEYAKAGEVIYSKKPVPMLPMLREIQNNLQYEIKERNIKLILHENLPSIICDPVRFQQVWGNLISNAVKYNDKREPKIEAGMIEKNKTGDNYLFFVKDNGIGISENYIDKIFNSFQRATNDKKYEGTGIGLAIVKRIIEFHKGEIWVESKEGRGSTFYFTIPKELAG